MNWLLIGLVFFVVFNLVMVVAMHKHEGHRRDGRGR